MNSPAILVPVCPLLALAATVAEAHTLKGEVTASFNEARDGLLEVWDGVEPIVVGDQTISNKPATTRAGSVDKAKLEKLMTAMRGFCLDVALGGGEQAAKAAKLAKRLNVPVKSSSNVRRTLQVK